MPRKGGPIQKRPIANVDKVIVVASGKGGVGKSTVALNLAFALALRKNERMNTPLRVGLLDLDIFGPSIPTLMGLRNAGEPALSIGGAILPMTNHGLPCIRQQLLFDVDWSKDGNGLDVLVVDMPPGTGDVPLTLGQLVTVDGSVIVSTPQDVALSDVRKGIAMLRKVSVPRITSVQGVAQVYHDTYLVCFPFPCPFILYDFVTTTQENQTTSIMSPRNSTYPSLANFPSWKASALAPTQDILTF
ncbi:P-loop containing nucleoside triphosphate hydrolase protein [Gymnopilus junonius]|uniref:P-loop containing nucleoside triphosphate hydrolase protein n=1 Tax=Gymnopilus junonius TaxID=109634 RepID=A0A9P5NMA2_GYMJU|nr:P-loop containing nucleoside triphosphate hydrolase protein [Gymnopilus junonius]